MWFNILLLGGFNIFIIQYLEVTYIFFLLALGIVWFDFSRKNNNTDLYTENKKICIRKNYKTSSSWRRFVKEASRLDSRTESLEF